MSQISIIIPAYNAETTIAEAIESILHQTYSNVELIIVNDGSTDNTESIILSYNDKRIKYFHQLNKGQAAANNFGLSKAKGSYIKFFDADDIININHLEDQYEAIKNIKNSIASCKWGRFYNGDVNDTLFVPELVWKDLSTIDWIKTALSQRHDMMSGWLWLIPKVIIDKAGGWDERLTLNNDFEFSVRLLLCAEKVYFVQTAILYYRTGGQNTLTSSVSAESYQSAYLSNLLGCNYLISRDGSKTVKRLCANRFQVWVFGLYPTNGEIVKKFEKKIKDWGGSNISIQGGRGYVLLSKLAGWKTAKKMKLFFKKYF